MKKGVAGMKKGSIFAPRNKDNESSFTRSLP